MHPGYASGHRPRSLLACFGLACVLLLLGGGGSMSSLDSGGSELAPRVPPCAADISHPLTVQLQPTQPFVSGQPLTVRVMVTAALDIDDLVIEVNPSPGIETTRTPREALGLLRAGESGEQNFTVQLPADHLRRTVDVLVRGHIDGIPVTRGATLNLNFVEEASQILVEPNGRRIHQVDARRID